MHVKKMWTMHIGLMLLDAELEHSSDGNRAKLMQVSTDYVFAGNGNRPYIEFDATNPLGVYGASKLAGEVFVRDFAKDYFIIRTAWLYGEGKNFVKTMLRLSETNDKVRVVKDQFGTPTSADELAKAIVHLLLRKLWCFPRNL